MLISKGTDTILHGVYRNCSHSISGKIQSTREWVREQEINHKIENELHSTSVEERSTSPALSSGVLWDYGLKVVVGALLSGGSSGEDTPKLSQVFGTISWRL